MSYAPDARSLAEILAMYEAKGFTSQFGARPGGRIVCFGCHFYQFFERKQLNIELVSLSRTEGASDPDDMLAVAALRCPQCQCQGTLVLNYGPEAGEDDVDVLKRLQSVDRSEENPT